MNRDGVPSPTVPARVTEVEDLAVELLRSPPWMSDAACRDADPVPFFPSTGEPFEAALACCARCPVRDACLAFAVDHLIDDSVWGGTPRRQRRDARRAGYPCT